MHGRVAKSIAVKVIEELIASKIIILKEYGKFLLYLANQDNFPSISNDELLKLDEQIKMHKTTLQDF